MAKKILIEHELKVLHKSWEQDSHRTCGKSSNISSRRYLDMKLLLKRQVRVEVANKVKPINMTKVATESRKPASSKFIHLSALRAYRRRKAWKLNVRRISNFQFALV